MTFRVKDPAPRVEVDEAVYTLSPSAASATRWDFVCERRVELRDGERLPRYVDFVHALPRRAGAHRRENLHVALKIGGVTRHYVSDALLRTFAEGTHAGAAFEWVGLLCRYGAARATLRLARADVQGLEPFGSVTDLTIGRERPVRLHVTPDHWELEAESPPPRTMLRIYWPLARP